MPPPPGKMWTFETPMYGCPKVLDSYGARKVDFCVGTSLMEHRIKKIEDTNFSQKNLFEKIKIATDSLH